MGNHQNFRIYIVFVYRMCTIVSIHYQNIRGITHIHFEKLWIFMVVYHFVGKFPDLS